MWYDAYAFSGDCGEMDFDPSFENPSMMIQLGKIIDSESAREVVDPERFNPVTTVITDDGDEITVTVEEATKIREAVSNVNSRDRLDVLKQLQTTEGLTSVLNAVRIV